MQLNFYKALLIGTTFFFTVNVIARQASVSWVMPVATAAEELEESRIFPFNYDRISVRYDLYLDIADSAVAGKYLPVFTQYKLPYNGDIWEQVLRQALGRIDRRLARQVQMLAEDDGLRISTGGKTAQQKFLRELLPVLSNIMLLENQLKRLDRAGVPE